MKAKSVRLLINKISSQLLNKQSPRLYYSINVLMYDIWNAILVQIEMLGETHLEFELTIICG